MWSQINERRKQKRSDEERRLEREGGGGGSGGRGQGEGGGARGLPTFKKKASRRRGHQWRHVDQCDQCDQCGERVVVGADVDGVGVGVVSAAGVDGVDGCGLAHLAGVAGAQLLLPVRSERGILRDGRTSHRLPHRGQWRR